MTAPIKNPTIWRPPSGQGSVLSVGNLPLVDNVSKLPLLDNASKLPIVTNPSMIQPKQATLWTQVG